MSIKHQVVDGGLSQRTFPGEAGEAGVGDALKGAVPLVGFEGVEGGKAGAAPAGGKAWPSLT